MAVVSCLLAIQPASAGDVLDEFKVKRQEVFEFTGRPTAVREGERVIVHFASKGFCDATVAIEDATGRILRHLASGVLGPNAPAPFKKDSLEQSIAWDGKDDRGKIVESQSELAVRVSLGIKPQYEKDLFASPKKRIGEAVPLLSAAAADGVYVFDSKGIDSLKVFDHDGGYSRTVYPFPADKLDRVAGLNLIARPQDGKKWPFKNSNYVQTLLTSGDNASRDDKLGMDGTGASGMDVRDGRIALAKLRLNRLSADGSSGGMNLNGPKTSVTTDRFQILYSHNNVVELTPTSLAISPDGKWLYLAGYAYRYRYNFNCLNSVYRMPLQTDGPMELFAGGARPEDTGQGDKSLMVASSVACDGQGRVYVSDYIKDRIKVFSPDGKLLKTIACYKPALIRLNRRTGEVYVFTWLVCSDIFLFGAEGAKKSEGPIIKAKMTVFGPFDTPARKAEYDLPLPEFKGRYGTFTGIDHGLLYNAEVDAWTDPVTVWLARDCIQNMERGVHPGDGGRTTPWESAGIQLLRPKNGRLEVIGDFGKELVADPTQVRARPPSNIIQHLYPNPLTGKLYVGEADSGPTVKAFKQLLEIDPESARVKLIDVPFNALDIAFDLEGQVYMRTTSVIARYDFSTWRETPFDYGEELPQVGCGMFGRYARLTGGLVMPSTSPVCFHQGGFHVSGKGNIVASCSYRYTGQQRTGERIIRLDVGGGGDQLYGKPYTPNAYPGRVMSSTGACAHIWDKHGQAIHVDAIPGMPQVDGIAIDRDNNIYIMSTPTRMMGDKPYFNDMSETLVKLRPGKSKFIGNTPQTAVPLGKDAEPAAPAQLRNSKMGSTWIEGAEWFFGGVGFAGFNPSRAGGGCACWFSRFALDYYGRSFAPEVDHYSVAVLDSAGNVICRVGRYGNRDSAGAKSLVPLGGDEVGLFHATEVGTHSDRRLFISDVGNGRIVSVKLDYHASERVELRGK